MAKMEQQELDQGGLDEAQIREKRESLATAYLRAIDLGTRDSAVLRRTVELLFVTGRGSEALQLVNRIPSVFLERLASRYAIENRDFQQAEGIARLAVKARPGDFQERIWLVRILMDSGKLPEAESEIRQAIAEARTDSARWITLVEFLVLTGQPEKAEQAVGEAQASLPQAPLALAQCCETVGRSYQGSNATDLAKKWYGEAKQWFDKAKASRKDPNDLTIDRQLAGFFLRTNQLAEAQNQLNEILKQKGDADVVAWATRNLALTYIAADPRQPDKALDIIEPPGRKGRLSEPEDLRVLVKVLEVKGTPEHRKRAIAILDNLVNQPLASPEDLFLLAQLEETAGDWIKAREQYRELIVRTDNTRDMETLRRRPAYLAQFAESLLRHHQPGEESNLTEVQDLIEKLKRLQPDVLAVVVLEVQLHKARNQVEEAIALIRSTLDRPNLRPEIRARLGGLADQIGQIDLAEEIYQKIAAGPATVLNKHMLVRFFVRHNQIDKAVDLCDSLWKEGREHEKVASLILIALADPRVPVTPAQIKRGIGWLEQGRRENPRLELYPFGMGNLFERLGEDEKAEAQYRAVIDIGDRDGTAYNNLAWLMALRGGNLTDALELINKAIQIKGNTPDYLDTRGVVYLSAGQGQSAVKDLEAAVAEQPTASKLFHLAQAYLKVKDRQKAKQNWEAAMTRGLPKGLHPPGDGRLQEGSATSWACLDRSVAHARSTNRRG